MKIPEADGSSFVLLKPNAQQQLDVSKLIVKAQPDRRPLTLAGATKLWNILCHSLIWIEPLHSSHLCGGTMESPAWLCVSAAFVQVCHSNRHWTTCHTAGQMEIRAVDHLRAAVLFHFVHFNQVFISSRCNYLPKQTTETRAWLLSESRVELLLW